MTNKLWDIVGYVYRADVYCPECIGAAMPPRGHNTHSPFQGAEPMLDELALAANIERTDESSFDSGDFPKIVFRDQAEDERCGLCDFALATGA